LTNSTGSAFEATNQLLLNEMRNDGCRRAMEKRKQETDEYRSKHEWLHKFAKVSSAGLVAFVQNHLNIEARNKVKDYFVKKNEALTKDAINKKQRTQSFHEKYFKAQIKAINSHNLCRGDHDILLLMQQHQLQCYQAATVTTKQNKTVCVMKARKITPLPLF
jgi:hypothetical protein